MQRFFERKDSDYYVPISEKAKEIIEKRPKYWEDKLFLELIREQRKYLDALIQIDSSNELSQYIFAMKTDELLVDHMDRWMSGLKLPVNINEIIVQINEARGEPGLPGDADKIIKCARELFFSYIYHIEMLYDIEYIYLPETTGGKIKKWLKDTVRQLIKQLDVYILDRFDAIFYELSEFGKQSDYAFSESITINIDMNAIGVQWVLEKMLFDKMNRKVAYQILVNSIDEKSESTKQKRILLSIEDYEEYVKLKREFAELSKYMRKRDDN